MDVAANWLQDVAEGLTFAEPTIARERAAMEAERSARSADILRALRARMDVFVDGDLRSNAGRFSLIEIQGTGEQRAFSRTEFNALMDLAELGCGQLFEAQKKAIG